MTHTITMEIKNIEVDDSYYSFDYSYTVDGKNSGVETYESDHSWGDDKSGFKKSLENGEAMKLVLAEIAEA